MECQRQSGSAFGMSVIVPEAGFSLVQGTLKKWVRSSDSGRPVSCYFCPECGTRIYHQSPAYAGYVNVKAGVFDDTRWLKPSTSIWMARKQPWLELTSELACHDGQP
jgi:hypothetical protein